MPVILINNIISIGNVYITDTYNQRIRVYKSSSGYISSIAGSSTSGSYSGDNSAASSATFNYPVGVALDSSGRTIYRAFFIVF